MTKQELFIKNSSLKHNNKYSYLKVIFINTKIKVIITCPYHGDFEQTPNSHLNGTGCPFCAGVVRMSNQQFIDKSNKVHGNKYGYTKCNYINSHTKVLIECPEHGEFLQAPYSHLNGHGCPMCMVKKNTYTSQQFIEKSNKVHGNKYGYDKLHFVNTRTKVIITCPEHGDFKQKPNTHLSGHGCPMCSSKGLMSNETFIKRAFIAHNGKYLYTKTIYTGIYNPITITCLEHGDFVKIAKDHLIKKSGCPRCSGSKGELLIKYLLEKNKIKYIQEYKLPIYKFRYDFYLPYENLFIEFHGEQHYEFIDFFHKTQEKYQLRKEQDETKLQLAKEYRIPVVIFNYKHMKLDQTEFEKVLLSTIDKIRNRKTQKWFCYNHR
jgi:hypothetical protein